MDIKKRLTTGVARRLTTKRTKAYFTYLKGSENFASVVTD